MYLKICISLLSALIPVCLPAQDTPGQVNFAHLYDPEEEILLHYDLVNVPGYEDMLILGMELKNESLSPSDYDVAFFPVDSYESPFGDSLTVADPVFLGQKGDIHYIGYPLMTSKPLVIVKVTSHWSGLSYFQDVLTDDINHFLLIDAFEHPVIEDYLTEGSYRIITDGTVNLNFYDHSFPAGRPPMTTSRGEVSRSMELTDTKSLDSGNIHSFDEAGLYTVSTSGSDMEGEAFRVQGAYYPEYVTVQDLVDPLIYFTTTEERSRLGKMGNDKNGFDKFWVELSGNQANAKWIIKNYYRRVEEANRMFTTYKEGWKTDRGMIYIMFGPPDQVIRNDRNETWSYLAGKRLPPMIYNFVKLQTRYADRQYTLIRGRDHENGWQMAAQYWRMARPYDQR